MEGCDIVKQITKELDRFQENMQWKFYRDMVACIEDMFELQYVFMHREFGEAVRRHPKGYVPFQLVLQQPPFLDLLAKQDIKPLTPPQRAKMGLKLHKRIRDTSRKLWSNAGNVRRMKLFDHQEIVPVYFENIPKGNDHNEFELLLASKCSVTKIQYNDEHSYAWVYTNDPQSLHELNGYNWSSAITEDAEEEQPVPNLRVYTQREVEVAGLASSPQSDKMFQKIYFSKKDLKYPALQHLKRSSDSSGSDQ